LIVAPFLAQPDLVPSTAFLTSPEYFQGRGMMAPAFKELDGEVQVAITRICGSDHHFCKHPLKIRQLCFASRSGTYSLNESSLREEILRVFGHFSALFLQVGLE
jgi:hypothetical protein